MADPGGPERIDHAADLTILRADNAAPMTLDGTRTYVLGSHRVVVIDPGPADPRQLAAIVGVVDGRDVAAVLLTHAHADHAGLAAAAAVELHCPLAGSAATLARLAGAGVPDGDTRALADGEQLAVEDGLTLTTLATPGHSADHTCYLEAGKRRVFTGDLVLGVGSSAILHPDGSVSACLASLARLVALRPSELLPGHGPPVAEAQSRLAEYRKHRLEREAQIVAAVAGGAAGVREIREAVYGVLRAGLARAADASVAAHLAALEERGVKVPPYGGFGVHGGDASA